MIKLEKNAIPNVLEANFTTWTATLLSKYAAGEKPTATESTRYRHPDVKQALINETNGKCAYCESKFLHVHHGDVEHIYPKSLARNKTFEWENLTLACEICNQNKSDRDPLLEHIIDPYQIDPALHLVFTGSFVFPLGTNLGLNTKVILDLNRAELCERRKEKLERVMSIYEHILNPDLPDIVRISLYENLKQKEGNPASEYSAMNNAIILSMQNKLSAIF